MTITGTFLIAVCVSLIRRIAWGVDPFTCLIGGLEVLTGLTYGLLLAIILGILLVVTFILDKHYIGLATCITLFLQGTMVDLLEKRVVARFPPVPDITMKLFMMAVALFCLCFGTSLYIVSDLGVSAYDAISLILSEKKGWKYRLCRILTDVLCVGTGGLLGGDVGILTIITAFCMGPLTSWMNVHWSEPIRYGRRRKINGSLRERKADERQIV